LSRIVYLSIVSAIGACEGESVAGCVSIADGLPSHHIHTPPVVLPGLDRAEVPLLQAARHIAAHQRRQIPVRSIVTFVFIVTIRSIFIFVAIVVTMALQELSHGVARLGGDDADLAGGRAPTLAADPVSGALLVEATLPVASLALVGEPRDVQGADEGGVVPGQVDRLQTGVATAGAAEL
jgi:hypothetical protein